jgi:predicted transposase/invertase (TIGR01784 family)
MAKKSAIAGQNEVHDTFFRQLLGEPTTAIDFVQNYLPANLVELLDLLQLRPEKDTFVDARLRKHFSDILFSVPLKSGEQIYLYLLFEHKSSPDKQVRYKSCAI